MITDEGWWLAAAAGARGLVDLDELLQGLGSHRLADQLERQLVQRPEPRADAPRSIRSPVAR